jgi:hypothetical protein
MKTLAHKNGIRVHVDTQAPRPTYIMTGLHSNVSGLHWTPQQTMDWMQSPLHWIHTWERVHANVMHALHPHHENVNDDAQHNQPVPCVWNWKSMGMGCMPVLMHGEWRLDSFEVTSTHWTARHAWTSLAWPQHCTASVLPQSHLWSPHDIRITLMYDRHTQNLAWQIYLCWSDPTEDMDPIEQEQIQVMQRSMANVAVCFAHVTQLQWTTYMQPPLSPPPPPTQPPLAAPSTQSLPLFPIVF